MSLLLDALKKAEKAKEAAQRGDKPKAPGEGALSLEPTPEEAKRVMTRDKLPDISTPLEIGSDDISPRRATASSSEQAAPPPRPAAPASGAAPSRPGRAGAGGAIGDPAAAQRAAAQSVLQTKFKEPNPRLPFYISVGVLGVFAIGTAVYFYLQLRPRPPLVNLEAKPPAGEQAVNVARAPASTPRVPSAPGASAQAIPGLPAASTMQPAAASGPTAAPAAGASAAALPSKPAAATTKSAARAESAAAGPTATVQPGDARGETPRAASNVQPEARATPPRRFGRRSIARVNPGVAAGYAAYQTGDLEAARRDYRQALRAEPRNIDALLGLAAVELRAGQYAAADRYYQQVLRLDPRNPHANAGMLALRSQQFNPVAAESRVKSLLAREPGAEGLQFTLGNQYAQQSRWNEAQQAYFKALASEPSNPDFAYNLAVSLDHLRQVKPALQHYQLALKLAETRSAAFDADAVRARIAQLAH
jgi:tetratricopeptide (TPR) repeat protein